MKSEIRTGYSYDGKPRRLFRRFCAVCKKPFWVPRHVLINSFCCSVECRGKRRSRVGRVAKICANCGASFSVTKGHLKNSRSGLFFCKRECKDHAQRVEGVKAIHPSHYKNGIHGYRSKAIKDYGAVCLRCGYKRFKSMLNVDHIDGNRENNAVSNLRVFCVWCDALQTRGVPYHRP